MPQIIYDTNPCRSDDPYHPLPWDEWHQAHLATNTAINSMNACIRNARDAAKQRNIGIQGQYPCASTIQQGRKPGCSDWQSIRDTIDLGIAMANSRAQEDADIAACAAQWQPIIDAAGKQENLLWQKYLDCRKFWETRPPPQPYPTSFPFGIPNMGPWGL